ncbi:4236_t:CDS:2, partial [Scutellospora calospora]
LELYKKDLTEEELRACANIATILINLSSEINIFITNDIFDDIESYIPTIEDIADFTLPFFNFNNVESYCKRLQSKLISSKDHRNIDFE